MDTEFLFLAIVCLATLAFVVGAVFLPSLPEGCPEVSGSLETYWADCDTTASLGHQADCELRQKIEDLNGGG